MPEEIIKRLSADDMLNDFYNVHLKEFISASINLTIWYDFKDMNTTAYMEPAQTIGPQGQIGQSHRRVTIAEAIEREETKFHNEQIILKTIRKIKKEDWEEKFTKELKPRFAKLK